MGWFSPDIENVDDLFLHTLQDIYYAEHQIAKALPEMVAKASDPELKKSFNMHLRQTKGQIKRLDRAFKALKQKPKGTKCPAIDGIIDEAQDLSDELLEQVRLLSNLETDHQKLMQIILMGQTELRDKLAQPKLRQLRQRITVRYHLHPLTHEETDAYVRHRLAQAGANGRPHFDATAIKQVYKYSAGIPRLINAVCDKALLAGFVQQTDAIDKSVVKLAIEDLDGVLV